MPTFEPCLLIPVYEHAGPLRAVLNGLKGLNLRCLLVDDGSSETCAGELRNLAQEHGAWVQLLRLEQNRGKGGAMIAGFRWAALMGHSHALQVDADGQHDLAALPTLLEAGKAQSDAVICGEPRFDSSAPRSRLAGRRLTNFWIAINTLSLEIRDGMCGLRLYPLAATLPLLENRWLGKRMDFDPEILVRLHWRGVKPVFLPVRVVYPEGGRSNFRTVKDNVHISFMHMRLFFGMLLRLPQLLWRKF